MMLNLDGDDDSVTDAEGRKGGGAASKEPQFNIDPALIPAEMRAAHELVCFIY